VKLSAWWKYRGPREHRRLASACGVTPKHLGRVAAGTLPAGETLALSIEAGTGDAVTRHDLRPDLFSTRNCPCRTCAGKREAVTH
jgi:DNA-binding transcriptional regulator YdaS (Cro superfamily)